VTAAPGPSGASGTQRDSASPARIGRSEVLWLLVLLIGAALLLHVRQQEVPMVYDMIGYASQGHSLLTGHGNTIAMGDAYLPGVYPVGVPAMTALAMALLGPDLRNGLWAVLACALVTLAFVHLCMRRAGLSPWAGAAALLCLLCSPLFRTMSGQIMSQVPTAAGVAIVMWLFLARDSKAALFLAGLLAMLSLLLRYANVSFPVALVVAEVLCGGVRSRSRVKSLAWLGGGLALGALVVLVHNVVFNGDAFATGYRAWGWHVDNQFSLTNVVDAPAPSRFHGGSILLSSFFGLGELHSVPMLLAAIPGFYYCWRDGHATAARPAVPEAWLLGGLAASTIACSYLLLAGFPFRADIYLLPTVPAMAVLAAYGATRVLERVGGLRASRLAPVLAAGLLAVSVVRAPGPGADLTESVVRYASLQRAGFDLEPDAALITTADSGLVEPLFCHEPSRTVLYIGPWVSPIVEEQALAELGADAMLPRHVLAWARAQVLAGRPVYLDQNPPPRGLTSQHVAIRTALRANFALAPTGVVNIFRLSRLDAARAPR